MNKIWSFLLLFFLLVQVAKPCLFLVLPQERLHLCVFIEEICEHTLGEESDDSKKEVKKSFDEYYSNRPHHKKLISSLLNVRVVRWGVVTDDALSPMPHLDVVSPPPEFC